MLFILKYKSSKFYKLCVQDVTRITLTLKNVLERITDHIIIVQNILLDKPTIYNSLNTFHLIVFID